MPDRTLPSSAILRATPGLGPAQRLSRRRTRKFGDEYIFKYLMLSPAVLWVVVLTFFPLFEVVRYSFADYVLGLGITGYVGFSNYTAVLASPSFWNSILITLIYVLVTVPVEVALGFLFAWLVNLHAPGTKFFRMLITAPLFTMEVAIGYLGITLFSARGGLVPALLHVFGVNIPWLSTAAWGLVAAMILEVWRWTPFVFLLALASLASIPEDIYDAAVIDCESHWQVMRHVAVPLAWPVMTIVILFRFIEGFKAFGLPYALTSGGPGTSTQLFSILDYLTTLEFFDFGKGSAMSIIGLAMISVVIAFFFGQMRKRME